MNGKVWEILWHLNFLLVWYEMSVYGHCVLKKWPPKGEYEDSKLLVNFVDAKLGWTVKSTYWADHIAKDYISEPEIVKLSRQVYFHEKC